jgi:hypothetical protein
MIKQSMLWGLKSALYGKISNTNVKILQQYVYKKKIEKRKEKQIIKKC